MHKFLGSIGFSKLNKVTEIDMMIRKTMESYDDKIVVEDESGRLISQISKNCGSDMGISVCGEYDEENQFYRDLYFPFFRGANISAQAEVSFERQIGRESFAAAYEDPRIGITMIFFLQNVGEYLNMVSRGEVSRVPLSIQLVGLAQEGIILFPIKKDKKMEEEYKENTKYRNQLITAARSGDEDAMENLTLEDIDTYSMISRRIEQDDILTIVDTYFMPYGLECDQYHILGDILNVALVKNNITGEEVYQMELLCNDIHMDVCVNKNSLFGEPEPGRRFKGVIWLQGYVNF
ncbi:MAG: DUF3881 family protein [Lachnospiraceae bacterium]|nr:DUF3881 family protein [Lachnospiraceae bacterium]